MIFKPSVNTRPPISKILEIFQKLYIFSDKKYIINLASIIFIIRLCQDGEGGFMSKEEKIQKIKDLIESTNDKYVDYVYVLLMTLTS